MKLVDTTKFKGDAVTERQKKKLYYEFMRHGIKGEEMPWDKLDKFIAACAIDKAVTSGIIHAMYELVPHGFTFTDEDYEKALTE